MKHYFPILFLLFATACNFTPANYNTEITQIKDSLFKVLPTVSRISIEIKNDFGTELIITLGDASLYKATDTTRQSVVDKTKNIAVSILGADKTPSKGTVVFVADENTIDTDNDQKKTYDMHLH